MKRNKKWSTFILLLFFFIGLLVMLYPALSNYWNQRTQSKAIVDYEKMMENIPAEDYSRLFDQAYDYNSDLSQLRFPLLDYRKLTKDYNLALNPIGTGMMGYINIEKIGVSLPIYHGTGDEVLSVAVGHVEGSSLPVGGKGNHTILSAHRGLPTATLFTNLDHLEIGDMFTINILDRTTSYQVDQINIVEPEDTQYLNIDKDEDLCTLITCTPYGINTHRLLVRGHQVEAAQKQTLFVTNEAYRIDTLIVTPFVALPMILVLLIYVMLKPVKKEKNNSGGKL